MNLKLSLVCKLLFLLYNIKFTSLETSQIECADEECTVPIGVGSAQVMIQPQFEGHISLRAGEECDIFGILDKDLFLVETRTSRKRGFVPQRLFREQRLKKKGLVKSNVTAARGRLNKTGQDTTQQPDKITSTKVSVPIEVDGVNASAEDKTNTINSVEEEINQDELDDMIIQDLKEKSKIFTTGAEDLLNQNTNSNKQVVSNESFASAPTITTVPPVYEEAESPYLAEESVTEASVFTEPVTAAPTTDSVESNQAATTESVDSTATTTTNNESISTPSPIVSVNSSSVTTQSNETKPSVVQPDIPLQPIVESVPSPPPTPPQVEVAPGVKITSPPPLLGLMKAGTPTVVAAAEAAEKTLNKPLSAEEGVDQNSSDELNKNVTESVEVKSEELKVDEKNGKETSDTPAIATDEKVEEKQTDATAESEKVIPGDINGLEEKVEVAEVIKIEEKVNEGTETLSPPSPMEELAGPQLNDVESEEPLVEVNDKIDLNGIPGIADSPGISTDNDESKESVDSTEESKESQTNEDLPQSTTLIETEEKKTETVEEKEIEKETPQLDESTAPTLTPDEMPTFPHKPTVRTLLETDPFTESQEVIPESNEQLDQKSIEQLVQDEDKPQDQEKVQEQEEPPQEAHVQPEITQQEPEPPQQGPEPLQHQPEPLQHQPEPQLQQQQHHNPSPTPPMVLGRGSIKEMKRPEVEIDDKPLTQQEDQKVVDEDGYCEQLGPNKCPSNYKANDPMQAPPPPSPVINEESVGVQGQLNNWLNQFNAPINNDMVVSFVEKALEMIDVIIILSITGLAVVVFLIVHSCVKNCSREGPLIAKVNHLERVLMNSMKENAGLNLELVEAKEKLEQIEDNSFGSNEMVISLRQHLNDAEQKQYQLQHQIHTLEAELTKSGHANDELNRLLAEALNSKAGSESIMQNVEMLQKQIDEQQLTIETLNEALGVKSRENSELQVQLNETTTKLMQEIKSLKGTYDDMELEKICIETELKNLKKSFDERIEVIEKQKQDELDRIHQKLSRKEKEALDFHQKYRTSEAKIQALNDCITELKKGGDEVGEYLDSIDAKAEVILIQKERDTLKQQLQTEHDARTVLEERLKKVTEEVTSLKKEFEVAEKEKLEAKTRLDVLSTYFKEKETDLQKQLSTKEALWMKQQGETNTTVERVRAMQDEIQQLKSQNDSLKAEVLAQETAHKAQTVALETKAHEAWLTARQSERKVEELRSEATLLRRRLTSFVEFQPGADNSINRSSNAIDGSVGMSSLPNDINNVPSPIRVESPKSPMLGVLPPPPLPHFMPPPPHFMAPPLPGGPPFMPAPFAGGRLISPPPHNARYSPSIDERDRDRGRYTPDSRFRDDYSVMTPYDTETDFSPPPSPPKRRPLNTSNGPLASAVNAATGSNSNSTSKAYSPSPPTSLGRANGRARRLKGGFNSSGSQDSQKLGQRKGGKI